MNTKNKKTLSSVLVLFFLPLFAGVFYSAGVPSIFIPTIFGAPIIGIALFIGQLSICNYNGNIHFKKDLFVLLLFSISTVSSGFYWLSYTMTEFGQVTAPWNYLLTLLFSLIVFPQYFFFLVFMKLLYMLNNFWPFFYNNFFKKNLFFAVMLTLFEYFTPQQFPAHPGHSWMTLAPFLKAAQFFGVPIFSFVSYWIALTIIGFIKHKKVDLFAIYFTAIFCLVNFLFPITFETDEHSKVNNIRMVQANIGNTLKLDSERGLFEAKKYVVDKYTQLSTLPSNNPLDLIIWPETAYPQIETSEVIKDTPELISNDILNILTRTNAEIFYGTYDQDLDHLSTSFYFENQFNSAFLVSLTGNYPSLKGVYRKMKLIPFGETLPFGEYNKFFSAMIDNISYFAKGKKHTLFKTRNNTYFISVICYEILFPTFIRDYLKSTSNNPHFIINITNDSWYGNSSEPYQHLFLAKWRALEFNIPIVRMTNTGISSVIYPDGSESRRIEIGQEDILDLVLRTPNRRSTVYENFGLIPLIALWILIFIIIMIFNPNQNSPKDVVTPDSV